MNRFGLSASWLLVPAAILASSGCQSEQQVVTVTGRLVENGAPIKISAEGLPPGMRPIKVVFHSVPREGQAGGESFHSQVNAETGEFTAKGSSNQGIPPGNYRISVMVLARADVGAGRPRPDMLGSPSSAEVLGTEDRLQGVFSPQRSPLVVEITKPSRLILDVGAKPGVTVE